MVDFGGWDMPLHYGSQLKEHLTVRAKAGMFDVSHMTVIDINGRDANRFLRYLLANDVNKLTQLGAAIYSLMLNETGGVIDDLIVYYRAEESYRLVVNCATRDRDLLWLEQHSSDCDISICERPDLAIIAVQGPQAIDLVSGSLGLSNLDLMKPFHFIESDQILVATTGYTGELGVEVILPNEDAESLWRSLIDIGVKPVGLGARDTLRLEAGYCLYGHEMDENVSPLQANLGWTLSFDDETRDFIGKNAVADEKDKGVASKLVGLVLLDKGVLRQGQLLIEENDESSTGVITSGSYSPSLEKSIALARVPMSVSGHCYAEVRGRHLKAQVVSPAFVRQGKVLV